MVAATPDLAGLLRPRLTRWIPHPPTEQQTLALVAPHFLPPGQPAEVFYGGAAGGGKSDWLLLAALQYVDVPGYAALLLRRTFADLALPGAIMARSHEWLSGTDAHWSEQRKTWTFPAGASVTFGYLENPRDVYRYQSSEYQLVGFDELTQFEEDSYTYLFSRLRRPRRGALSKVPLRMFSASNPGGIGHGWVKQRFPIDGKPRGERVFIPAKLADNPHVDDAGYRSSLAQLPPVLQQQLLDGDWGAFEGAAFSDFREDVHVVEGFDPGAFDRFESMDFGAANPTAWHVHATDYDGNEIVWDEYYAPGLVSAHAAAIHERRKGGWVRPREDGWVADNDVYGDPSIRNRYGTTTRWGEPASILTEFNEQGIHLIAGNNDRQAGYMRVAELLRPDPERVFPAWHARAGEKGSPRLFIDTRCPELIEQLRSAPIEDQGELTGKAISRKWEGSYGHATASLRYGVLSWASATTEPAPPAGEMTPAELRREFLDEHIRRVEEIPRPGSWIHALP